jgi:uncharacterized protein (TIGR02246 family)
VSEASRHEADLRLLLDREAIREVIARGVRGVDRLDADLLGSAFHPDGIDEHHGHPLTGDTIGAELTRIEREIMQMTSLHITTQTIRVSGDRAGVESYYLGLHRPVGMGGDKRLMSSGRMLDQLERRDGQWRIIRRQVLPDMARTLTMDDEFDLGPPLSRRDRDDPSYAVLFE